MNNLLCPWEQSHYLIFSDVVPQLFYYSHLPAVLVAIFLGILIYIKSKNRLDAVIINLIFLLFSLWAFLDIVIWANNRSDIIMFLWTAVIFIEPLIYVFSFYLFYSFLYNKLPSFKINFLVVLVLLPFILSLPTNLTLTSFNLSDCVANEHNWSIIFSYGMEILSIIIIAGLGIKNIFLKSSTTTKSPYHVFLFLLGLILFLFAFSSGNIIGSTTGDWELAQYGLFGMPIFIGFLTYIIVRFRAFNIKLIGTQALVVTLWFLVGSLLFVAQSNTTRIVASVTLLITTIAGYFLVRSVKKEVKQREQIEELAVTLDKANERLKILDKMKSEFVSIASHQLRSPLTSIRGYASMLAEGSYGKLAPKAQEIIQNIADSSMFMAQSVEDYLNVSRIEAGNMKYEMSDFNLKDVAEKVVDEMRSVAMKKGLVLMFRSDCTSGCMTHADIGKTRQVIMNLLDNSMKYTPKGTITVVAHDDVKKKKMYVTLQDTGVGMSKETQEEVFDKFVRAKNANNINVTGTGLGLFVAKKMIEEMAGRVWAESEGEGKGSTFHIELPLVSGK